ncbi:hypothetical protein QBC45DRAFT_418528 [Copromyces sp. CBS 386.78]|nr:hypothetical protein QBC45DRAFT_418528 [Copromyces sp. CBS 386.78]
MVMFLCCVLCHQVVRAFLFVDSDELNRGERVNEAEVWLNLKSSVLIALCFLFSSPQLLNLLPFRLFPWRQQTFCSILR